MSARAVARAAPIDDGPLGSNISALLSALEGHIPDDDTRSRLSVDLRALAEASRWYLTTLESVGSHQRTAADFQDLLVELEARYLDHASQRMGSLRRSLWAVLSTFPEG